MRYLLLALTGLGLAFFTGCGDDTTDDSGDTTDDSGAFVMQIDGDFKLV